MVALLLFDVFACVVGVHQKIFVPPRVKHLAQSSQCMEWYTIGWQRGLPTGIYKKCFTSCAPLGQGRGNPEFRNQISYSYKYIAMWTFGLYNFLDIYILLAEKGLLNEGINFSWHTFYRSSVLSIKMVDKWRTRLFWGPVDFFHFGIVSQSLTLLPNYSSLSWKHDPTKVPDNQELWSWDSGAGFF